MKIVIISRSLPCVGGREVIIEHLIAGLKKKHSILLLTPDIKLKRKNVRVVDINLNLESLEKIIKEFEPDIINCHTFYFFKLACRLSKQNDIPLVTTLHGMFLRFYGKDYRSLIRDICNKSDAVTVVSDSYKKELIRDLRVTGKNIFVIKNGVPLMIAVNPSQSALRMKYHIPKNKIIVVVPARINKIKGLIYLVRAAKKLKNNAFFFLECSPKERGHNRDEMFLKEELLKFGLPKDLLCFQECSHSDLLKLFGICDICLLPSLMEGISISLLEAMAIGCFVIATKVGGNSELIVNGINGFLIKPKTVGAITEALKNFENLTRIEKEKISMNAKHTVRQDFSRERMIQSYEILFFNIDKNQ